MRKPADEIHDLAIGRSVKRVDRQVAPLGIRLPIPAEGNHGTAPVCFNIAPQGGDFERLSIDDQGDGAMRDACRHRFDSSRLRSFHHRFRQQGCGYVDVGDRQPHQTVADGAADHTPLAAIRIEQRQHALQSLIAKPGLIGNGRHV